MPSGKPLTVFLAGRRLLVGVGRLRRRRRDELRPGVAAVARGVEAAAGAAADQLPRPTPRLPQPGEQHAWGCSGRSRRRRRRCRRPCTARAANSCRRRWCGRRRAPRWGRRRGRAPRRRRSPGSSGGRSSCRSGPPGSRRASRSCRRRRICRCRCRPRRCRGCWPRRCRRRSRWGRTARRRCCRCVEIGWSSKIGFQRMPPSVDFQTPPAETAA